MIGGIESYEIVDKYTYSDPRVLREKMEGLHKVGGLPVHGGKVARERFAIMLGLPKRALKWNEQSQKIWQEARQCVDEFDSYLGKIGQETPWDAKVPAIRAHLEDLNRNNSLPVNNFGNLNLSVALAKFGYGRNGSGEHLYAGRALNELIKEFNEIVHEQCSKYKYDYLEEELKKILGSPDVPISHGRKLGVKKISEALGVHRSALKNTPKLKLRLDDKQKEIDAGLRCGVTGKKFNVGGITYINIGATPWSAFHGRVFDFSDLVEPYGLAFAEKVGTVFVHIVSKLVDAKYDYYRINHFLLWLAKHDGYSEVVEMFKAGEVPGRDIFERATLEYKQDLLAGFDESRGEADSRRKKLRLAVIRKFSAAKLFPPHISLPNRRRRQRSAVNDRNPRPSLVEAIEKDSAAILNITLEAAHYRDIEFDSNKDTIAFANTLAAERARRDDLPQDLVEAITFLCDERLTELRRQATKVFMRWFEIYQHGQSILANAEITGEEIALQIEPHLGSDARIGVYRTKIAELFPKSDIEKTLVNMLVLLKDKHNGVCPPYKSNDAGSFFSRLYVLCGGSQYVQSLLLPTREVISAAICLYLCESGANSSVGLLISTNSLRKSKLPQHVNIVSTKGRSKGKSIYNDLPMKCEHKDVMTSAEALTILKGVGQPLRSAEVIGRDDLLVYAAKGSLSKVVEWQLRADIKKIANSSDILSGLTITPSMIRPTVLLHAQLVNPGSLTIANMLAQHDGETTTMGYVAKLPFRRVLEERIREFQNTLQVVIAGGGDSSRKKLGIEADTWNALYEKSQRTGLGVYCSNPYDGEQKDFPIGEKCMALDRCIECKKRIVIAHPESIADMIIWQEALERAQKLWLEERTHRWEEVWVPWQAFFYVVLNEKMSRGGLALIKKKAMRIAQARKCVPGFQYPEPW